MRSLHNVYEFLHKTYWNLKIFVSFLCCFRFHLGAECSGACFSLRPWWFSTQLSGCAPPSAWTLILCWPSPLQFGFVDIVVHKIFVHFSYKGGVFFSHFPFWCWFPGVYCMFYIFWCWFPGVYCMFCMWKHFIRLLLRKWWRCLLIFFVFYCCKIGHLILMLWYFSNNGKIYFMFVLIVIFIV